jgi:hypothetical protein
MSEYTAWRVCLLPSHQRGGNCRLEYMLACVFEAAVEGFMMRFCQVGGEATDAPHFERCADPEAHLKLLTAPTAG